MKRVVAEYPYNEYYLYVVFHKSEGRRYANLVPMDTNKNRKTISYARYLMSVKEHRILEEWEHVDHIDNDKTNDSIDNLQILSITENNKKYAKFHGVTYVKLKCPNCGTIFSRQKRNTFLSKSGKFTGCSRTCSATFGVNLHNNPNNIELLKKLNENVICEYTINE